MSRSTDLRGSLLHDDVFHDLQLRSPFALTQWLSDIIVEFLKQADEDSRCRLLSFAWATSVLRDPTQLLHVANALATVTSTSDVGIDTALLNVCRARIAIAESKTPVHNTHWIRAAQILDSLPDFSARGLPLAQDWLNLMFKSDN